MRAPSSTRLRLALALPFAALLSAGLGSHARAEEPAPVDAGAGVADPVDAGGDVAAQPEDEPDPAPADDGPSEPFVLPDLPSLEARKPIDPHEVTKKAPAARRKELSKEAYRFCHDPSYGKQGTDGRDFCLIFDETSDEVCPEASRHCKEWRDAQNMCEDLSDPMCRAILAGKGGRRRARPEASFSLPTLPPAVAWTIIGTLGALALVWFVRALRKAGWESADREADADAVISEAERNLQALPEARSSALLRLAERALARGDDAEAAILLHLAVLRHLDDAGLARYHPSKTNGDYLRAIRGQRPGGGQKPLAALFRGVARETERLRFGDGRTDGDALRALLEEARRVLEERPQAEPIEPAAGPATLAVLALFALSQHACRPPPNDPAYHTRGPAGMAALPEVLREAGLKVEISRSRLASLPPDVGVVVIRSSAASSAEWPHKLRIDATLDKNVSVVVIDDLWNPRFFLPVTATATPPLRAVDVAVEPPSEDVFCTWRLGELAAIPGKGAGAIRLPEGRRLVAIPEASTATISAKALKMAPILGWAGAPKLPDGRPAAVAWAADRVEHGTSLAGCIYVFADRDLFTNASLTREPNARFAAGFFAALARDGRKIVLLDRLDPFTASSGGTGDDGEGGDDDKKDNPTKSLRASNLLPFLAQAGVLLVAFFLAVGAAFGPLRDPVVREHKSFVEHVEAIGRQYARTGIMGLTHSARSLARLVVMRNRDLVRGSGAGSGWSGVAQHLAHKHELDEDHVRAALRLGLDGTSDLGQPGPHDPTPSSERMLRTLSRLLGGREPPKRVTPARPRAPKNLEDQGKDRHTAEP